MNIILKKYAKQNKCSVDDILNNYEDLGWLEIVKDFHKNPKKYLTNWKHSTYGNGDYVKDVLGYYIGIESVNKLIDGTEMITDLITLENTYEKKADVVDFCKY